VTEYKALQSCDDCAWQVIHREATITSNGVSEQPFKVILNKKNKKNGQF